MNPRNAASAYREASIENAPPIKIVRMLYQGALRFIDRASADEVDVANTQFPYLVARAEAIVTELRVSLDPRPAPDVAENLEQLYLFVEGRLRAASDTKNKTPLGEARKILASLLDAWQHIEVHAT